MKKMIERALNLYTDKQVLIVTSTVKDAKVPAFKRIRVRIYIDGNSSFDRSYMTQGDFDSIADKILCDILNDVRHEAF
mgnify:CR=1 FL=1